MAMSVHFGEMVQRIAMPFVDLDIEKYDFDKIKWGQRALIGYGKIAQNRFNVELDFSNASTTIESKCSICGYFDEEVCQHAAALLVLLDESGIAEEIETNHFGSCSFTINGREKKKKSAGAWKSQLNQLAQQLRYRPAAEPEPARFPTNREAIYVISPNRNGQRDNMLEVTVASRAIPSASRTNLVKPQQSEGKAIRNFSTGVRGLSVSSDAIDREIAEKISLVIDNNDYYPSRRQIQFSISPQTSADLFGRLARSGKLYFNDGYTLTDQIIRLGWLHDDLFDLKFQIAEHDEKHLSLGICAVNASMTVPHGELKTVEPTFFIDTKNQIGLFSRPVSRELFDSLKPNAPLRIPRDQSADLIENVLGMSAGLGTEFVGCEDIRPTRVAPVPKPRIHIRAPDRDSNTLEASVKFDYDGVQVDLEQRVSEVYDRGKSMIIAVDRAFHDRCLDLLHSVGVRTQQGYDGVQLSFVKKKLPAIVSQLMRHGWHVEAEGKLYRTGSQFEINIATGIDWFELQGKAHFDQTSIDLPRLLRSLRAGENTVVLDDGSIGIIPEQWIARFSGMANLAIGDAATARFSRSQIGLLDALLVERGDINVDEKFAEARNAIRAFERIAPQPPPPGFVGTLRPYQELAQGWFEFLRELRFGGCLADDMGLGKTIQVLAMLEQRRAAKSGPSLIVVPRSLIFNWVAEAAKFTPNLRVLDQSHAQRRRGTEHLSDFDVVLTTYGTLRRDAAFLKDFEFDYVILDEAQAIKNAATEAAKAARLLSCRHRLALSGTPIENHIGELWSLFDFLNPGMLGRVGRFGGIVQGDDQDERKLIAAAVRPFILRRTKKQVAPELPDRIEQTVLVELDADQRKGYDELRAYYRTALMNKIASDGIGKSQIVILEALLRLRQAACHPGLIDKARSAEPSAKLDELLQRLHGAMESNERVLVFSQFTSLLAIVKSRLKEEKIDFLYLDGQTTNRQALVEQFQSGTGPAVFLISLKAGGVGLNLTAARTVILLDPWWNPAVEAQAIDRTHRIGQLQTVFATRLIAADTVEQKVLELQAKKKNLADAIVNADNTGISSITREDLELLLA